MITLELSRLCPPHTRQIFGCAFQNFEKHSHLPYNPLIRIISIELFGDFGDQWMILLIVVSRSSFLFLFSYAYEVIVKLFDISLTLHSILG